MDASCGRKYCQPIVNQKKGILSTMDLLFEILSDNQTWIILLLVGLVGFFTTIVVWGIKLACRFIKALMDR